MAIFKRGWYYQHDFEPNGHRYFGSTKRTSKQKAESVMAVLRKRILDGVQGGSTQKLCRRSQSSLTSYLSGPTRTSPSQRGLVEEFKLWRSKQPRRNRKDRLVRPATTNRALTVLKRIFSYADALGMNVRNPVRHVKFLRESAGRMRVLSIEEVEKCLAVSKGDLHDFALLMVQTGDDRGRFPACR